MGRGGTGWSVVGDSNSVMKSPMFRFIRVSRDSMPSCEAITAIISFSPMSGVRSAVGVWSSEDWIMIDLLLLYFLQILKSRFHGLGNYLRLW